MNNEIKEILDYLKEFIDEDRLEQINLNRWFVSSLLDYITNLQEKLEVAQDNEESYRLEMQDITKCLGLDEHTLFDDVKDYATNLQQENKRLKEDLIGQENLAMTFSKTSHEYYQRIEKAIRLIEEYHYFVFTKDIETIYKNANKEFINILSGRSDE